MSVGSFGEWNRLGRPLTPAQPIKEIVARLKQAFPHAAGLFSWFADETHYEAHPPQDHTPYSTDGWPNPDPRWVVFATDVMHRPDLGVDCHRLFAYWIAEARAGRMPWLKYLIWQAKIYDVRFGWREQDGSDHFDHIHISTRTDHQNTGLGTWSLVPEGDWSPRLAEENTMTPEQEATLLKQVNDINFILWRGGPDNTTDFRAYFAELKAELAAQRVVIEQLAAALAAGGGAVDTKAILDGVDQRLAALRTSLDDDLKQALAGSAAAAQAATAVTAPPAATAAPA